MKSPDIDLRTKQDIINYIKEISSTYTPEWRFDEDNPDIGSALALIYADMMSGTIKRFNRVFEKNCINFFDKIGTQLLPEIPASGYVTFGIVNDEVMGTKVKRGTKVIGSTNGNASVVFETVNDVYVTPARLSDIYLTDPVEDAVVKVYDVDDGGNIEPFHIFEAKGVNYQKHELFLAEDTIFCFENECYLFLRFKTVMDSLDNNIIESLLDYNMVQIGYYSEHGYVEFEKRDYVDNELVLYKGTKLPRAVKTIIDEKEHFWIHMKATRAEQFKELVVDNIFVRSKGGPVLPTMVNTSEAETSIEEFFPFGERPSIYEEVYFSSPEVLSKKGALVQLKFDVDFVKFPLDYEENEIDIKWKMVMTRADFKIDKEYDITIDEVIWEYFNGNGWTRLFKDNQHNNIFSTKGDCKRKNIILSFYCPENMSEVLVNSEITYCIRARILKMSNLFKLKGNYIAPLVSNPVFSYVFDKKNINLKTIIRDNNLEVNTWNEGMLGYQGINDRIIYGLEDEKNIMYLGFKTKIIEGPIKIFIAIAKSIEERFPRLWFEYSANNKWKNLSVVDETKNFMKSGIITFFGNSDMHKRTLFGKERYWIRIIDVSGEYGKSIDKFPCITNIYMNTTQIKAIETMPTEYFFINQNEENKSCRLAKGHVYLTNVWVDELRSLSLLELKLLEKNKSIKKEYDDEGQLARLWVKWTEVNDFSMSSYSDRHYRVDHKIGIVYFSNGKEGKIPDSDEKETIMIEYNCGGGQCGNLAEGMVNRLLIPTGFINSVQNNTVTSGGIDNEVLEDAITRQARAIRHGERAVMPSDYEALSYEANRNILSAKCYANHNQYGTRQYGHIALVLLHNNYEKDYDFFEIIKNSVLDYMRDKVDANLLKDHRLHIVDVKLLYISVLVNAVVDDYNYVFEVKESIEDKLKEFINPISGNFNHKGWSIGTCPNRLQIMNALSNISNLRYIKDIQLSFYEKIDNESCEVSMDNFDKIAFIVPVNGIHKVFVEVI